MQYIPAGLIRLAGMPVQSVQTPMFRITLFLSYPAQPINSSRASGRQTVRLRNPGAGEHRPFGMESRQKLSGLRPAFVKDGKVTAGNAPGLNDGAAAVVVASQAYADQNGLKPLARIVGYGQAAVEPKYLFAAPAKAIPLLLEKVGWRFEDLDLVELNEAFAAQVLADGYALADQGWDWQKVNLHGGAIALGHPIGASGARVLVTLIYALKDRGLKRGIASLCLGGGEAVAMAVEVE